MNPVRRTAVLLDRYPLWLDALEQVLGRLGIVTVGRAATPEHALTLVARQRPDLLVGELDGIASSAGGRSFLARARAHQPELRAVVVSDFVDKRTVEDTLAAGAAAYVAKTVTADELTTAIRQAFDQSIYLPSRRAPAPPSAPPTTPGPDLTKRELEILRLVAEGHSNAQLARMLWVTEQTVKFHLSNVYRKLDVANRTEASRWAQVHNLLPAHPAGPAVPAA
jgi:DNA-binding NarL/FixJ family response regulator